MKSIEDVRDYLLKNRTDESGDLDLSELDFSEFDGSVMIRFMKVKHDLFQDYQTVGEDLMQDHQKVVKNTYQDRIPLLSPKEKDLIISASKIINNEIIFIEKQRAGGYTYCGVSIYLLDKNDRILFSFNNKLSEYFKELEFDKKYSLKDLEIE